MLASSNLFDLFIVFFYIAQRAVACEAVRYTACGAVIFVAFLMIDVILVTRLLYLVGCRSLLMIAAALVWMGTSDLAFELVMYFD